MVKIGSNDESSALRSRSGNRSEAGQTRCGGPWEKKKLRQRPRRRRRRRLLCHRRDRRFPPRRRITHCSCRGIPSLSLSLSLSRSLSFVFLFSKLMKRRRDQGPHTDGRKNMERSAWFVQWRRGESLRNEGRPGRFLINSTPYLSSYSFHWEPHRVGGPTFRSWLDSALVGSYWVVLGCTGFDWVWLLNYFSFLHFQRTLDLDWSYRLSLGRTGFDWVWLLK